MKMEMEMEIVMYLWVCVTNPTRATDENSEIDWAHAPDRYWIAEQPDRVYRTLPIRSAEGNFGIGCPSSFRVCSHRD